MKKHGIVSMILLLKRQMIINSRVEINRSIMELNFRKEKLQNEINTIQANIDHLVAIREINSNQETPLFDDMFGG